MTTIVNPNNYDTNSLGQIVIIPTRNGYNRFDERTGKTTNVDLINPSAKAAQTYNNSHNERLSKILDKSGDIFKNIGSKAKTIGTIVSIVNPEQPTLGVPIILFGEGATGLGKLSHKASKIVKQGSASKKDQDELFETFYDIQGSAKGLGFGDGRTIPLKRKKKTKQKAKQN